MTSKDTFTRIAGFAGSLTRWIVARIAFAFITLVGMVALNSNLHITAGAFAEDYKVAAVKLGWALLALFLYKPFLTLCDGKAAEELSMDRLSFPRFAAGTAIALMMLALPVLVLVMLGRAPMLYATPNSLMLATAIALQAAIIEEIIFRGFLLQLLLKFLHPILAALLVALIFAASHLDGRGSIGLLSVFLAGLTMTAAFFVSRSLWLPIGIHFGWDFVIFVMQYFPAVIPNSPRASLASGIEATVLVGVETIVLAAVVTVVAWNAMKPNRQAKLV